MAELRTLLKSDEQAALYAVSVDPGDKSRELKRKIASDGKGAVAFPILSDAKREVIEAYGIRERAYDGQSYGGINLEGIPQPSVFVIDKDGRVVWANVEPDYKKRPTNAEIRSALDALKK